jgi:uncharacterized protein YchJ
MIETQCLMKIKHHTYLVKDFLHMFHTRTPTPAKFEVSAIQNNALLSKNVKLSMSTRRTENANSSVAPEFTHGF